MCRHIKNSLRLLRAGFILARHDALFLLENTSIAPFTSVLCKAFRKKHNGLDRGQRLSNALRELGPSYIKFGQSLSTRSDIIGEDVAHGLASLRDKLPPFSTDKVKEIIEADFGKPINELFKEFNDEPVAAASIAQVHFAVTNQGDKVAVKVARPDICKKFAQDIELLRWLAEILSKRENLKRFKPLEVIDIFEETVQIELDLLLEASSASELRENMADDKKFYVPDVFWHLTSSRVMTMERVEGIKISEIDALKEKGHNLQEIVKIAAQAFFMQLFRDGYFHADLHPGNLFVMDDGRIAIVDFGIMGRVSLQERIYLAEILRGFLQRDYRKVAQMHFTAGYVPAHKNVDHFTTACRAIGEPVLDLSLNEISVARLLEQLFSVAASFEMQVQPQLLLLQKTMMVAEGLGRTLAPEVNMWKLAEPLVVDWAKTNLSAKAHIKGAAEQAGNIIEQLPTTLNHVQSLLKKVDSGGLKLHPDTVEAFMAKKQQGNTSWKALAWVALIVLSLAIITK